jgi:hypothetical protein
MDHDLKAVADTDDQMVFLDEGYHLFPKMVLDPAGKGVARSGVITTTLEATLRSYRSAFRDY